MRKIFIILFTAVILFSIRIANADSSAYINLSNNLGAYTPTVSLNDGEVISLTSGNLLRQWRDAVVVGRGGMSLSFTRSLNAGDIETVLEKFIKVSDGAINHSLGQVCVSGSTVYTNCSSNSYASGSLVATNYYAKKLDIPGLGVVEARVKKISDFSSENKILYNPDVNGWDISWAKYRGIVVLTNVSPNQTEHARYVFLINAGGGLELFNAQTGVSTSRSTGNVILQNLIADANSDDADGWQDPLDTIKSLKLIDGQGIEYSFNKNFKDTLQYQAVYGYECGPIYNRHTCYDNYDLDGWRVDAFVLSEYSDGHDTVIKTDNLAPQAGSEQVVTMYLSGRKWQSIQRKIYEDKEEWFAPGSRKWTLTKDSSGKFVQIVDPENGVTKFEYSTDRAFSVYPQVRKIGLDDLKNPSSFVQIVNSTGGIVRYEFFEGYKNDADSLKYIIVSEIPNANDRNNYFQKYYRVYSSSGEADSEAIKTVVDGVDGLKTELSFVNKFGQLLLKTKREIGSLKEIATNYLWDVNETDKTVNGINRIDITKDGYSYTSYAAAFDLAGRVISIADALNGSTIYSYLISADSVQNSIKPDSTLSPTEASDILRKKDLITSVEKSVGGVPKQINFEYSNYDRCGGLVPIGKVTKVIKNSTIGDISDICYDAYGNITSIFNGTGSASATNVAFSYDQDRIYITENIAVDQKKTKYNYDHNTGNLLDIIYPNGSSTSYDYDLMGRLVKIIFGKTGNDAGKFLVTHEYIRNESSSGLNITTKIKNSATNQVESVTEKLYDGLGFQLSASVNGLLVSYDYDGNGRLVAVTHAGGKVTRFEYDGFGRLVGKYLPGVDAINYSYKLIKDNAGSIQDVVSVSVSGLGVVGRKSYDLLGRLVTETKFDGEQAISTNYTYDSLNNIVDIISPTGLAITNDINYTNNKLVRTYPGNDKIEINGISSNGSIEGIAASDSLNNSISAVLTYDDASNLGAIDLTSTSNEDVNDVTMTYGVGGTNADGRLKDIIDHYGSTSFWYGTHGQVEGVKRTISELGQQYKVYYEKDIFGNVLSAHYPHGLKIYYVLDAQKRVVEVRKDHLQGLKIANIRYFDDGNIKDIAYPNGVKTEYEYDIAGRVARIAMHAGDKSYLDEKYEYDGRGRKIGVVHLDGSKVAYEYDGLNRLLKSTYYKNGESKAFDFQEYAYDEDGNRISYKDTEKKLRYEYEIDSDGKRFSNKLKKIYRTNPDGSESLIASFAYKLGSVVKYEEFKNGTLVFEKNYSYDADRRLIAVNVKNSELTSTSKLDFEYDYAGRREKKTEDGVTEYFIYGESLEPLIEINDKGEVDSANIYIGSLRIAAIESDKLKLFHSDELGNVLKITDDEGVVTQTVRYDAFGNINFLNGSDNNNYLFAGKQYDQGSGLVYFGARYYDPSLGRYMSMDPLAQGINHYIYADNNPLVSRDIFGLLNFSGGGMDGPIGDNGNYLGDDYLGGQPIDVPGMNGGGLNAGGAIFGGIIFNAAASYLGIGGSTGFTPSIASLIFSTDSGAEASGRTSVMLEESAARKGKSYLGDNTFFDVVSGLVDAVHSGFDHLASLFNSDDSSGTPSDYNVINDSIQYDLVDQYVPPMANSFANSDDIIMPVQPIDPPSLGLQINVQGGTLSNMNVGLPVQPTTEISQWRPTIEFPTMPTNVAGFEEQGDKPGPYIQEEHAENNTIEAINDAGDPILLHSGDLVQSDSDLKILGRGIDFEFKRTYRSRVSVNGPLGYNWDHSYNKKLVERENGDVARFDGDARFDVYTKNDDGTYTTPPGKFDILSKLNDGTYSIRDRHGNFYLYGADNYIASIIDSNNNIISFNYETVATERRLSSIVDSLGREIIFEYFTTGPATGKLYKIVDFANRAVTFAYDDNADLISVTSPEGNSKHYTYSNGFAEDKADLNHNLISVADGNGNVYLYNVYSVFDRVVRQQFGSEGWFEFEYNQLAQNLECNKESEINTVLYRTTVKDRSSNTTVYDFNCQGNPLKREEQTRTVRPTDPASYVTSYEYNLDGLVKSIIYPEGNRLEINYQETSTLPVNVARWSAGNPIRVSKIADSIRSGDNLVMQYEYEPLYNKPIKIIDAKNLTTAIWYDYQEGIQNKQIATQLGVSESNVSTIYSDIPLRQGDLNANGVVEQFGGKVVRINRPSVTTPNGDIQELVERFHYNDAGQLATHVAANGVETAYTYAGGYLSGIVKDPSGIAATTTFGRDLVGNVTSATGPDGHITEYKYNNQNDIIEKKDPAGNLIKYTYDVNDNLVKIERQNLGKWEVTEFEYNILGRMILKRESVGEGKSVITEYKYDLNENLVRVINPEGDSVLVQYDERDLPYLIVKGFGSDDSSTSTITYDGNKNPVQVVNALGNATKLYYDGLDRRIVDEDVLGNKTSYGYDPSGAIISVQKWSPTELIEQFDYSYDEVGRVVQSMQSIVMDGMASAGRTIKYQYDPASRIVQIIDPQGGAINYTYDAIGNLSSVTDAIGNQKIYSYDDAGRVLVENSRELNGTLLGADNIRTYSYDALGRVIEIVNNAGESWKYEYDNVGNLIGTTDPINNVVKYEYDDLHRLIGKIENQPDPISTRFGWDDNSRLDSVTDANGNKTTYTYDTIGRRTSSRLVDGSVYGVSYDKNSSILSFTSPDGSNVSFRYDPLGRMTGRTITKNGFDLGSDEFSYDELGRLIGSKAYEAGSVLVENNEFAYDSYGNLVSNSALGENIINFYDLNGSKTGMMYPNGSYLGIDLDPIGRITGIIDSSIGNVASTAYAGVGRKSVTNYANGTSGSFDYDDANRMSRVTWQRGSGDDIAGHLLSYNGVGNIISDEFQHLAGKQNNFDYDNISRLTNADLGPLNATKKFNYDKNHNFTSVVSNGIEQKFTVNNLNQYDGLIYDENGNIISDGKFNYEYNWRNQISNVYKASDNALIAKYQYDSFGRRVSKLLYETGEVTRYVYEGYQVAEEQGVGGVLKASYIYSALDEPIAMIRDNLIYYYHYNYQNSIEAITDQYGNVVERYTYDPFGKVTITDALGNQISESQIGNPYYFTGQTLDPETGLYNYRNRYYNPELGRFVSRDPLGYADSMNMYAYVLSNPVNKTDPYGLKADWEALQPVGWKPYSSETWNMSALGPNAPAWYPYVEGVMVAGPAVALTGVAVADLAIVVVPSVAPPAITALSIVAYNGRLAIMSAQYEVSSAINSVTQYVNLWQAFIQNQIAEIRGIGLVQYSLEHPENVIESFEGAVSGYLDQYKDLTSGLQTTSPFNLIFDYGVGRPLGSIHKLIEETLMNNNYEDNRHPKK